jgi:hypothetical protein
MKTFQKFLSTLLVAALFTGTLQSKREHDDLSIAISPHQKIVELDAATHDAMNKLAKPTPMPEYNPHGETKHRKAHKKNKKQKSQSYGPEYEADLINAVDDLLQKIQTADKEEAKIIDALEKYQQELNDIDEKYADVAKAQATERLEKMAEQKAKWHNWDLAYKNLKNKFATALDPYWKAQQELGQAIWNQGRLAKEDENTKKMVQHLYRTAMRSLEFKYSQKLAQFQEELKELQTQFGF